MVIPAANRPSLCRITAYRASVDHLHTESFAIYFRLRWNSLCFPERGAVRGSCGCISEAVCVYRAVQKASTWSALIPRISGRAKTHDDNWTYTFGRFDIALGSVEEAIRRAEFNTDLSL